MCHFFWNTFNENVVILKFFFVASKERFVELKGSAHFTVNQEVFHLFSGIIEFDWVFDLDNTRIEWSGDVSSNLRFSID